MEQVYLRYPEDREAAVFYGLALNASALPTDKTYANKQKAALILNKVWAEQPNHPGVVHYLIHSDDTAQFAQAGLDAAICYSKIAPDVPHALHMPSHIFTRRGRFVPLRAGARARGWIFLDSPGFSRLGLAAPAAEKNINFRDECGRSRTTVNS